MQTYDLSRFIIAHKSDYATALSEIKNGHKESHWIWYIFPQLKGLGRSSTSEYYALQGIEEARAFLEDEYLSSHLIEISRALLEINSDNARAVMGRPDDMKLKSSMTLFSLAKPDEPVFSQVLDKYFQGKPDQRTKKLLGL